MKSLKRKSHGFTLTELAIVIGVMSILVTVIVPSVVQQAQNNFGEIVVKDMTAISDAAEWWYHRSHIGQGTPGVSDVPWAGTWPSQAAVDPTAWPIPCANDGTGNTPQAYLTGTVAGFNTPALQASAFVSPYNAGGPPLNYSLMVAPQRNCAMVVHAFVPTNVANMVENLLPNGTCAAVDCPPPGSWGTLPGAAPAGFVGCCSYVVRPGLEASLAGYDPVNNANLCDTMYTADGSFSAANQDCVFNTSAASTNCAWRTQCLSTERAIGARCSGKYCLGSQEVWCCQVTN